MQRRNSNRNEFWFDFQSTVCTLDIHWQPAAGGGGGGEGGGAADEMDHKKSMRVGRETKRQEKY